MSEEFTLGSVTKTAADFQWYALKVKSGHEEEAIQAIRHKANEVGLGQYFNDFINPQSDTDKTIDNTFKVKVQPGTEEIVAEQLRRRIELKGAEIQESGDERGEIHVTAPPGELKRIKNGLQSFKYNTALPGQQVRRKVRPNRAADYIIDIQDPIQPKKPTIATGVIYAHMVMNSQTWSFLKGRLPGVDWGGAPGKRTDTQPPLVHGFFGADHNFHTVQPVSEHELTQHRRRINDTTLKEDPTMVFNINDEVELKAGPFAKLAPDQPKTPQMPDGTTTHFNNTRGRVVKIWDGGKIIVLIQGPNDAMIPILMDRQNLVNLTQQKSLRENPQ